MDKSSSQRLPPLKRNWWLKHRFFKLYMLREATVLPLVFFTLCLLAGMVALLQGAESWQGWLAHCLAAEPCRIGCQPVPRRHFLCAIPTGNAAAYRRA